MNAVAKRKVIEAAPLRPLAQFGASYSYVMPVPPSLNSIYKNVPFTTKKGRKTSRRSKTDAYEDWCLEADWELARQKPVRFDRRVDVSIVIAEIPNADIDNRAKPILDSLKRCGVIKNDNSKYVRQVCARWSQEETACRVNVYHAPEAA